MAANGSNDHQRMYPAADSPIGNIASLEGKIALITGGSSGLGRAISLAYAAAGAYVVSADLQPTPPPAPIIEKTHPNADFHRPTVDVVNAKWPSVRSDGAPRAVFIQTDVTSEESVSAAVKYAVQTYGRLDIMVNNAGIGGYTRSPEGETHRLHETEASAFDKTMAVNVRGVWLGVKHAVIQFLSQEPLAHASGGEASRGWIINLASILSSVGMAGSSSYCTSKGAVLQLTRAAALEYAKDRIHVNAIQPGFTDTHILEDLYARAPGGKSGADQFMAALHPWGRTGRPEEMAKMAVFLAGDGASWITGSGFVVDGGYLAQ